MYKVLIADSLGEAGVDIFRQAENIHTDVITGLKPEELKKIIGEYDGLVIRSATNVTEDILEAAVNLKVIGRAGIGLDNVDLPGATKRGIIAMNTPTGNVVTTAEHAIAMMMSLTRNIPPATASMKAGQWEKKKFQGRELYNKVFGLVGYGKIGSVVADRARGLKMNVLIYDPFVVPEAIEKAGFESVTLEELYQRADYISVHVPKMKDTVGMINKEAIAKMKDGVMLINCARGGIINEKDLYDAIVSGKVAGAALDVFEIEPPTDNPLLTLEQVVCTPHLGASTYEAQTNVGIGIAEQIIDYFTTGTIINAVNAPSISGELLAKIGPLVILGEKIGNLLSQLCTCAAKEIAVEYCGDFESVGKDLSPVTTAVIKGFLEKVVSNTVNFVNAQSTAVARGIKITESASADAGVYINQIKVTVVTECETHQVWGTIFGRTDPRILHIDDFRLELRPEGRFLLINNVNQPGAIGNIGTTLGNNGINISRMHVGQEENGSKTMIVVRTDSPVPDDIIAILKEHAGILDVTPFEL